MNMRKIIAVLAAMLLLCAAIPMAAISVSAAAPIYSEDFEDGTLGTWNSSDGGTAEVVSAADLPVANPNGGNYAMKSVVESGKYPYLADSKAVTLEPNTDYVVSVDVLHTTNKWPIEVVIGGTSWLSNAIFKSGQIAASNTSWTTLTFVFNSGSVTTAYMGIKSSYASATFYVDNYTLTKADPADVGTSDGYIFNGNFESGKSAPWTMANGSEVVADPTGAGQGYVVKTNENTGSGTDMFTQPMNNLKANTNYKLSFKVYGYTTAVSNAAFYITFPKTVTNWSISTSFGTQKPKDYIARVDVKTSLNAWYPVSITFNTGDLTSVLLSIQNYRAKGGQYYFDDFKVMEVKEPTSDGYLLNGNFETGDLQGWGSTSCTVVDSPKQAGDYAVHVAGSTGSYATALSQTVAVEPNTEYAIAYWYTLVDTSKNIRLYVHDGADKKNTIISAANGGSQPCLYGKDTAASNGVWKMATMSFNSGDQTSLYLKVGGGSSGYAECYVDSFIMWKVQPASNDGYIVNGDFETGTTEGLKVASQTYVSPEAAKDGNFGLYMINSAGNWGGVGSWTVSNLEAGATYKLEWDMKAISKGFNWTIWQDNSNSGVKYANGYFKDTAWTHFEKEFVANTSTLYFNINGGNTGVSEEVYLDNLKLTLVKPAHTCNVVEQERVDADCVNDGYVKYACECGEGAYTETIKAKGHTAGAAADCENAQVCTVCGAVLNTAIGHKYSAEETKAPTCGDAGVMTYTCACGDSYTEAIPATGAHEFFNDCDTICINCYQEVREASHNIVHVDAVAPTCTAMGNVEYWYCDACGAAWLDAECTMNTNLRAVKLPQLAAVASIGDALYASLADALADAANGEIVLLADIDLAAPITVAAGQTVTLNLNGYTVTYNSTTQGEAMITNYGTLTINDSKGNGVINYNYTGAADPSYGKGNHTISNSGNLTINGGYITIANLRQHAKYPIDNNSTTGDAELVINGGHLYNYNTSAIRMFCNSTVYKNIVTINGGLIEGYCAIWVQNPGKNIVNAQLSITGGEIKSTASAYVNNTAELKDVSSAIYCTINGVGGAWDENSLISITGGVINENVYLADSAPSNLNVEGEAEFNGYVELPVPPCEHEYFYPCDAHCMLCGELTNPDASHTITHVEAVAPTCDAMGNLEFWYCADCGMAWLDEACTLNTNMMAVKLPAAHTYTDNCDSECDVCGEWRFDAPHNLTYVPGVVPANCLEEGYDEYWKCEDCKAYFGDAEASWQVNPGWMYYTGDCVRPEGSIPCAVVQCTVCGNDVYGEACTRPENAPVCQDTECIYCGEIVWGWGCNYNTGDEEIPAPLCQPGDCVYCGTHYEKLYDCENGSWAPCSYDGECSYGCGKQYPATGEHVFEEGVTACDGGLCWLCWEEIEGTDHVYTNAFDTTCNVCDAERAVVAPVIDVKKSISEDVNGLAFRFEADVTGFAVKAGTFVQADYTNATYNGYKLIETGVTATNGVSTVTIKGERMCELDENGKALFAYRIVNIPADKLDVEITMTPYYIIEIDGEIVTIEGDAVVSSYAEVAIG